MKQPVRVALIGIAGYGRVYVNQVLDLPKEEGVELVAAIARRPERCDRLDEIKERGAKIYASPEEFFAEGSADLVIISSPIHLHAPFTCMALENGANVLCEKPTAPTVQEALQMKEAEERTGKFAAIGYQWSYSGAIQALKKDIVSGAFGKPIRFKALVCWPRTLEYYQRNDWAARIRTDDGHLVLDSPLMNATAHYLHNMLYLLGSEQLSSVKPAEVLAELYRVNKIENYDIGTIRCKTEDDTEIFMCSAHAISTGLGPLSHGQFEKADVYYERYDHQGAQWIARFRDGTIKAYGDPNDQGPRLMRTIDSVRTGEPVLCGIEAANSHLICINAAQESTGEIHEPPENLVRIDGEGTAQQYSIIGIEDALVQCYNLGLLPSEHGDIAWAKAGTPLDVRDYSSYPSK